MSAISEEILAALRNSPGELLFSSNTGTEAWLVYTESKGFLHAIDYRPRGGFVVNEWGEDEWKAETFSGVGASGQLVDVGTVPGHVQLVAAGFSDVTLATNETLEAFAIN